MKNLPHLKTFGFLVSNMFKVTVLNTEHTNMYNIIEPLHVECYMVSRIIIYVHMCMVMQFSTNQDFYIFLGCCCHYEIVQVAKYFGFLLFCREL